MNHLLSLEFGKNVPLGLSGGATPSAKPAASFAALLGAPLTRSVPPGPSATSLVAQGSVTQGAWFADLPGTTMPAMQLSDRGIPTQPQAAKLLQTGAPAETAMALALDIQPVDDQVPAKIDVAEVAPLQPSTQPEESPSPRAPAPEPVAPVRDASAPKAEPQGEPTGGPPPKRLQPELAIDTPHSPITVGPGDARDSARAMAQPGENRLDVPADIAAPDMEQTIATPAVPLTASPAPVQPVPVVISLNRPITTIPADDARAKGASQRDPLSATAPKVSGQGDESALLRPSPVSLGSATAPPPPNSSPIGAGTNDFASMLEGNGAESAAPAFDAGSPAAELLPPTRTDTVRNPAAATGAPGSLPATVSARPGEIGHQLGVEIVRHGLDGRDSLTIRLDPVEMGEIRIRLQFDDRGTMRAHILAESGAALEILRRDSGDLVRALGDAGVRTDAQSFQFESRSQGRGDQHGQHGRPEKPQDQDAAYRGADDDDHSPPPKARANGLLDLFA